MIIILSIPNDSTTFEICRWLNFYSLKYKVVFPSMMLKNIEIKKLSRKTIQKHIEKVFDCKMSEIDVIWCRKWGINDLLKSNPNLPLTSKNIEILQAASKIEMRVFNEFIFKMLPEKKIINSFINPNYSKLTQLIIAQECGLKVPNTHITDSLEFVNNECLKDKIITKAIENGFGINYENEDFTTFTSRIETSNIISSAFSPSLIQNEIEKAFEIRTFILGEKSYSMAIFSQENIQTQVDLRVYDKKNPNKKSSYVLPKNIESKIFNFMKKMNLSTGSIDFIVDKKDNYYFLEVNPYGQFGMVSKSCNYNLENEVAKFLMKYGKN